MTGIFQFIDCSSVEVKEESQEIWPCLEAQPPFYEEEATSKKFLVLRLKKKPPSTDVNKIKQEIIEIKEEVIYDDAESINGLPKEPSLAENYEPINTEFNSDISNGSASYLNETLSIDTKQSTTSEDTSLQIGTYYKHIIEVQANTTLQIFIPRSNMSNLEKAIDRVATGADSATHEVLLNHSKIKVKPSVRKRVNYRPKGLTTCKYKTCFNMKFPNEMSFIKHLWVLHSVFMCEICKRRFPIEFSLADHKQNFHSLLRQYKCMACRNSFLTSVAFKNHKCNPDLARPYKCSVCSIYFSTEIVLRIHQFSKHIKGPFACNVCKVSAVDKGGLKRHGEAQRYRCHFCRHSFLSKLQLRKHIEHHNFVMSTQIRSGLQLR